MDVIEEYVLAASISAVVKRDYDQCVVGKLRETLGTEHYTFAVQSSLAHVSEWRATDPAFADGDVQWHL